MAKSFINGGKINEKYFRDGFHLTPEGSHCMLMFYPQKANQFACCQKH
jgi:hypothetical protein